MFNSIRGTLSEKRSDSICIDSGGIEFELSTPSRSVDSFGRIGEEARAYTWLHHWEEGMRLFGFPSAAERSVFLELLKVEGIGPKQALKILSGIAVDALDRALSSDDLPALQAIPGVGPKLAQKMLLALKGRIVLGELGSGSRNARGKAAAWADVVRALADMGFDRRAAEKLVASLEAEIPEGPEKERELFRRALLGLSAGA